MESEPPSYHTASLLPLIALTSAEILPSGILVFVILMVLLIICSGLISASEVAFFGLNPNQLRLLEEENSIASNRILELRKKPRKLLATILIGNNFVNIALVIVSEIVVSQVITLENLQVTSTFIDQYISYGLIEVSTISNIIQFLITTVFVTIILLLFGEIAPKFYAGFNHLSIAKMMSTPLKGMNFLFSPFSSILVGWSTGLENRINRNRTYQTGTSKEDLDAAIDLTVQEEEGQTQQADILKGIIKFGDLSAKQVMKPRVDIVTLEESQDFAEILAIVRESGYSRIPVHSEDLDHIIGILYVKDLLGYTHEKKDFKWMDLIRDTVFYVPESRKIDDLLRDFQLKRMHMAIVVDEFGGTLGIITLEDIMEEVIGDIKDEFDEDEDVNYIQLDADNFIFEGKTLLNDVCRIIGEKSGYFDDVKQNSDSLAGLVIEHIGSIPRAEKELNVKDVTLKIVSATQRRIEKINLRINRIDE
ncbi:MAG: gliding motility-associated protein GldE [Saprospiraceae bacterium]|nr:gliding motility-associated protein GldE [Saprospiraceae bacterium]